MYLLILIILIAIGIAFYKNWGDASYMGYWSTSFFCIIMGLVIGSVIGLSTTSLLGWWLRPGCSISSQQGLYALRDSVTTQGAFFLGSGIIDGNLQYFFYENNQGGQQAGSLDATQAIVYQDEQKHPYIQNYAKHYDNPFFSWITLTWMWECPSAIHIPKNSILQNYSLNLGK